MCAQRALPIRKAAQRHIIDELRTGLFAPGCTLCLRLCTSRMAPVPGASTASRARSAAFEAARTGHMRARTPCVCQTERVARSVAARTERSAARAPKRPENLPMPATLRPRPAALCARDPVQHPKMRADAIAAPSATAVWMGAALAPVSQSAVDDSVVAITAPFAFGTTSRSLP